MQQVPLLPLVRIILKLISGETVLLLMLKRTSTLLTPIDDLLFPFKILTLIKNQRTPFVAILLLQISNINDETTRDQLRSSTWFLRNVILFSLKMVHKYRNVMQKLI